METTNKGHELSGWCAVASLILFTIPAFEAPIIYVDAPGTVVYHKAGELPLFRNSWSLLGIADELSSRNILLAAVWTVFLITLPIAGKIARLLIDHRSSAKHLVLTEIMETWSLIPVGLLTFVIISLKSGEAMPSVSLGPGFWLLTLSEAVVYTPAGMRMFRAIWDRLTQNASRLEEANMMTARPYFLAAVVLQLVALIIPFFDIIGLGQFSQGPYTIIGSAFELYSHGVWVLGTVLILFSVVFPISKLVVVGMILYRRRKVSTVMANAIHRLGPWSMLDTLAVTVLLVAYTTIPFGALKVEPKAGFWCFFLAVVLNSLAAHLAHRPSRRLLGVHSDALEQAI